MECLDKFKKKMNYSGSSLRDENINNSIELLKDTFYDDASYQKEIYFWELGSNDYENKNAIPIRIYDRKFSNANGVLASFQTLHETPIIVGDIIYNNKSEEYFICTESFNIDDIHWQGKFTLCNWILRWQDANSLEIYEYPCVDINATQYNSGEQSNKNFTVGSSQHMITLPCDDNTVRLSSPKRFFLDKNKEKPTSFIVTQNDSVSYNYGKKGLVKLTVMEYASDNATDRVDLGICDYVENKNDVSDAELVTNDIITSTISYKKTVIKSGGSKQTFIGKFLDQNGNEITDITPKWDIICDFKNKLEVNQSDNTISISVDNDDLIDEEFKLVFSDNNNNYSSTLLIKIESLF